MYTKVIKFAHKHKNITLNETAENHKINYQQRKRLFG